MRFCKRVRLPLGLCELEVSKDHSVDGFLIRHTVLGTIDVSFIWWDQEGR